MSARIVELSRVAAASHPVARRQGSAVEPHPAEQSQLAEPSEQFQFWAGASGHQHVHSVFSLIGCPELPRANYMLVRREADGDARILRIARTEHEAPSLNLAEIRHRGAKLGANEVHVHFLARTERQRRLVEFDLRAAHFTEAAEKPSAAH